MSIKSINGCIGCGTCVATCPTDVIRLNPINKRAEIKYPEDCMIATCPAYIVRLMQLLFFLKSRFQ